MIYSGEEGGIQLFYNDESSHFNDKDSISGTLMKSEPDNIIRLKIPIKKLNNVSIEFKNLNEIDIKSFSFSLFGICIYELNHYQIENKFLFDNDISIVTTENSIRLIGNGQDAKIIMDREKSEFIERKNQETRYCRKGGYWWHDVGLCS